MKNSEIIKYITNELEEFTKFLWRDLETNEDYRCFTNILYRNSWTCYELWEPFWVSIVDLIKGKEEMSKLLNNLSIKSILWTKHK